MRLTCGFGGCRLLIPDLCITINTGEAELTKLEYTFKTDILFKMLFTQNPELLKNLVSTLLSIPLESIKEFKITNSEIPPDNLGEKFCRLDITMIVDGDHLAIEIQVEREEAYSDRLLYYWAREYSSALPEGGDYKSLPRTVIISIIDFIQFRDSSDFHSEFRPLEVTRHEPLSDKMSLHFFELKKLPAAELTASDKLLLWLSLFKADTEEEIAKIKALKEPTMEQAINAYEKITVNPEFKEKERQLHYARLREATALRFAR
jgi:predicted transposase/invertase (TIGR01784 family)